MLSSSGADLFQLWSNCLDISFLCLYLSPFVFFAQPGCPGSAYLFQWSTCVHTCSEPPQLSDGGGRDQVSTEFQVFPRYSVSSLRSASYSCSTFHLKAGRQGTILARSTYPVLPAAPLGLLLFPCSTRWPWSSLMSKQGDQFE